MFQGQGETKLEIHLSSKHVTQVSFRVLLSFRQVCSNTKNSKPAWEFILQILCIWLCLKFGTRVQVDSNGWQHPAAAENAPSPLAQAVSLLFSCCNGAQKVTLLPPLSGRAHNRDY